VQVSLAPLLLATIAPAIDQALSDGFIPRLFSQDPTLWGDEAVAEASIRLGWVCDPMDQLSLVEDIEGLRAQLLVAGARRVILCGMGGSSLAPEVMALASGADLTVIDTVHPDALRPLLESDLADAVVVVSSKSGGTVETDSQRRMFEGALSAQGIDATQRIVVVTDPGSPLDIQAQELGYRVFWGNPAVGGRFSALTAFGLVPAGLAGVPLREVIDDANDAWKRLSANDTDNDGLLLGAAIASGAPALNKLLISDGPGTPGFGNWVEQLVAESTGKDRTGILPVISSSLRSVPDGMRVGPDASEADIEVSGAVGGLFLLWEVAVAFASQLLGVNPFDQPNVESAKLAARNQLGSGRTQRAGERTLGSLSAWGSPPLPRELGDVPSALSWLLRHAQTTSYVGLCVFDAGGYDAGQWRAVAHAVEQITSRPVTLGFGPRFLHSTGQFHKGGPAEGVFLQVIALANTDLEIPGRDFTATELLVAQAHGDADVLAATNQPVLSLTVAADSASQELLDALALLS
jgi:hypothetical protein